MLQSAYGRMKLSESARDGWQALSLFRVGYPTHVPNKSPRRAVER